MDRDEYFIIVQNNTEYDLPAKECSIQYLSLNGSNYMTADARFENLSMLDFRQAFGDNYEFVQLSQDRWVLIWDKYEYYIIVDFVGQRKIGDEIVPAMCNNIAFQTKDLTCVYICDSYYGMKLVNIE